MGEIVPAMRLLEGAGSAAKAAGGRGGMRRPSEHFAVPALFMETSVSEPSVR